jgi:hypothetical protein
MANCRCYSVRARKCLGATVRDFAVGWAFPPQELDARSLARQAPIGATALDMTVKIVDLSPISVARRESAEVPLPI